MGVMMGDEGDVARLRDALSRVRQELWVDYCLVRGRTDVDPKEFNSKPHIRIIDDVLEATRQHFCL